MGGNSAGDDLAQKRQLSVKEMATTGKYGDREILRPRPVHHRAQRHGVILLTVDQERARLQGRRYRQQVKAARCGTHQHQMVYPALGEQPGCRCDGYKSAK
jgi:hypothetical protein